MEAARIKPTTSGRYHPLLRGRMAELDMTGIYLARKTGMCREQFSFKMTGKKPWGLDEMYIIMDELDIPHDRMHEYFPDYRRSWGR